MNTQGLEPSAASTSSPASWPEKSLRALFGQFDWQPPRWLATWGGSLRRQPMHWLGGAFALIALMLWWHTRPVPPPPPDAVTVELREPEATDYTKVPPKLSPLRLRFSDSAAPLDRIGKAPEGVGLKPAHPGTWLWSDDRTLVFTPAKDWPVATGFEVRVEPELALAPGVPLERGGLEFATPPFTAEPDGTEFYQDP